MGLYYVAARAERDLYDIWEYVAKDKPIAALELVEEFHAKFRLIADAPESGPRMRPGSDIRVAFVGRYVVYYRPAETGIEVRRVLAGDIDDPTVDE